MKKWRVLVEANMDASDVRAVDVKANTAKKAEKFAVDKLKKEGVFHVFVIKTMLAEANK